MLILLGTKKGVSVKECVEEIKKIISDFKVMEDKRRPGDPPELIADNSKARKLLSWNPKYSDIQTIIKTMWDVYKK